MKVVLKDHGKVLHWAGAHHLFPVRGTAGADDVSFASHGALDGRTPIGWQEFFPALDRTEKVVVADDEDGSLTVVGQSAASLSATSGINAASHH